MYFDLQREPKEVVLGSVEETFNPINSSNSSCQSKENCSFNDSSEEGLKQEARILMRIKSKEYIDKSFAFTTS